MDEQQSSMEINNFNNKNLLVVGGTGFIGQHIVKESLHKGLNVWVLSKNSSVKSKFNSVNYLHVDIRSKELLQFALKDKVFDYIINLGGYVDHANYSYGGEQVFNTHFDGLRNLINCVDRSNLKSFIQIGSSDEYGNNEAPQIENQREDPISSYSCAKVAATYFLQMLHKTENFPVVILRPFLIYGPQQNDKRFIPQVIKGCLEKKEFPTSKGLQIRDFCFIDDFVRAIFCALNNKKVHGEILNIASGKQVEVRKIINLIIDLIGAGTPKFGKVAYRVGENMELFSDISKSKKLLNWEPKVALEEGLSITIDYYRDKAV